MTTHQALGELEIILKNLLEKEDLCSKGLLQNEELDSLYKLIPQEVEGLVNVLNEYSIRIYTKYSQIHKATTRYRDSDLTNIASKKEYNSYIKPWIDCINDILSAYKEQVELKISFESNDFNWLKSYPKIKKDIMGIKEKIDSGDLSRGTMDDIRLLIENFLQLFLGNNKSLENQLELKNASPFKEGLKKKGVTTEIITWLENHLVNFANYQNTYVKHQKTDKQFSYPEAELVYLQIGSIIKYLTGL